MAYFQQGYLTMFGFNFICEYIQAILTILRNLGTFGHHLLLLVSFFVGLPASHAAAGSVYVPTNPLISQVLPFAKAASKYGCHALRQV